MLTKPEKINISYFKKFRPLILLVGIFIICYSVVFYISAAWTDAPGVPIDCPSGWSGCDAPVNVGPTAQVKIGSLQTGGALRTDGEFTVIGNSYLSNVNVYGGVGIGTSSSGIPLRILTTTGGSPYEIAELKVIGGDDLNYKRLDFKRARGTEGVKTTVLTGDSLGIINFQSWDGTAWGGAGFIKMTAPTNGWGGDLTFWTSDSGTSGSHPRMTIMNNGNVGIGTTTPVYSFEVLGSANIDQLCISGDCKNSWGELVNYWTASGNDVLNTNSGNVVVGLATSPILGKFNVTMTDADSINRGVWASSTKTAGDNYVVGGTAIGVGAPKNVALYGWAQQGVINRGLWVEMGDVIFGGTYPQGNPNLARVGIDTLTPQNSLDIKGSQAIGTYAGVNIAPANSLIVSGKIGVGTTTPKVPLHISLTGGADRSMRLQQDDTTQKWNYIEWYATTSRTFWVGTDSVGNFRINPDAGIGLVVKPDGMVSIRSLSTPEGALDVRGTGLTTSTDALIVRDNGYIRKLLVKSNGWMVSGNSLGGIMPSYRIDVRGAGSDGQINAQGGLCISGDCRTSWGIAGTLNYLSKFTSTSTISNSQIFDNGTNTGIGTTTPTSILHLDKLSSTTTITVGGSKGACLKLRDDDNGGWTYCTTRDGSMTCGSVSCE